MEKMLFGLHKTRFYVSTSYCLKPSEGYNYSTNNLNNGILIIVLGHSSMLDVHTIVTTLDFMLELLHKNMYV